MYLSPHRSVARAASPLERSMGFAAPPHGGFAFIAAPERQSARGPSYDLGGVRRICQMAIFFLSLGGLARMPGAKIMGRTSENPFNAKFGPGSPGRGDAPRGGHNTCGRYYRILM